MKHEVIVPSAGESINEVFIGTWLKKTGDLVKKDEVLLDLETQKTTFEIQAEQSGRIEVLKPEAETRVRPGDVIAIIDDSVSVENGASAPAPTKTEAKPVANVAAAPAAATATAVKPAQEPIVHPSARKLAAEKGVDTAAIAGSGKDGRILKEDVQQASSAPAKVTPIRPAAPAPSAPAGDSRSHLPVFSYHLDESRGERREPASRIRRTIAQNLVAAQHTAAILTTFNEADMTQVLAFRKKHKDAFKAKHGVGLGMVSLFAAACVRALKEYKLVNSTFTGEDVIYRDFVDMGVAVSTETGLVVPIIRDADKIGVVGFEKKLDELSKKAKDKKLSIAEMTGGTFTISNGGVFGSLLSTPILNMPQSGILGLHKIQERPVALDGQVVIRPMMYLALSYDHRIIDGREAVSFLVRVKEGIEKLDELLAAQDIGL
ncbi:MAG TPA: 2-oxoglutarate dehydrogenase complex dihydrolipoyllysine-residue succinyltransferase [bacterium]|nr:2-oxoglutarate dehydrogenase complex dihydrolipoyllysine-residue succinyltransferase [bacterium]